MCNDLSVIDNDVGREMMAAVDECLGGSWQGGVGEVFG